MTDDSDGVTWVLRASGGGLYHTEGDPYEADCNMSTAGSLTRMRLSVAETWETVSACAYCQPGDSVQQVSMCADCGNRMSVDRDKERCTVCDNDEAARAGSPPNTDVELDQSGSFFHTDPGCAAETDTVALWAALVIGAEPCHSCGEFWASRASNVYHFARDCRRVSTEMSRKRVRDLQESYQKPCRVCGEINPGIDAGPETAVWTTEYGDYFHLESDCRSVNESAERTRLIDATREGLGVCARCKLSQPKMTKACPKCDEATITMRAGGERELCWRCDNCGYEFTEPNIRPTEQGGLIPSCRAGKVTQMSPADVLNDD